MCISAMMQLYFPKHHRSFQRKTITDDALRLLAEAATLRMLQTKKECEKREGNKEGKGREGKGREGKRREGTFWRQFDEKPSFIPDCPGG